MSNGKQQSRSQSRSDSSGVVQREAESNGSGAVSAESATGMSQFAESMAGAINSTAIPLDITPTEEQSRILALAPELLRTGARALVIEAGAGTGKTKTLQLLASILRGLGQYTAFNSSLVAESKAKFGKLCPCNTTHSLAFREVGKKYAHRLGGPRIKSRQVAETLGIKDFLVRVNDDDRWLSAPFLAGQVLGAIRRFTQSADREINEDHFRYLDGIDLPDNDRRTYTNNQAVRQYLLPFAQVAWKDMSDVNGTLPFSHDHYVKIWQLNSPVISADYILLDEDQDTAPVMVDVLQQQADRGALIILVGDAAQQIYEWRGAINATSTFPYAPRLMLSQSFRFGPAIADVANAVLAELSEKTPLVLKGLPSIPSEVKSVDNPTCILCRTNAVAVSNLLSAIDNGRKPFLVGGGSDVIAFVEGAKDLQSGRATSHPELACFTSWREVEEYSKLDEGEDLELMVRIINEFGCDTILNALRSMPEESSADLVISTAHKCKGREWNSVKLARDFPTKSKASDSDLKLLYVAVTRAKLELDITECPFFTGSDALDITSAAKIDPGIPKPDGVIPPAPSTPPAPTKCTWSKYKDRWVIRASKDHKYGDSVEVVRKDGSKQTKRLGEVVAEFNDSRLYQAL